MIPLEAEEIIILKNCNLFHKLPDNIFDKILITSQRIHCAAGETLLQEGEQSDLLFVIIKGSVSLYKENIKGPARVITTLKAGESIGEMRLLENLPCSLSAKANEATDLLAMSISALRAEPYGTCEALLGGVLTIMNERIRVGNSNILERINDKFKKMKQLTFVIFLLAVISFFFAELFFAFYYINYTSDFCRLQQQEHQAPINNNFLH